MAFEDPELAMMEKAMVLVGLLYVEPQELGVNLQEAVEAGVEFLNGRDQSPSTSGYRLYSFEKDARAIMTGFRQTYQIDLATAELHWWDFISLMMDLSPDCSFTNMVSLRHRVKSGKATKHEKEVARNLGDAFEVEDYEPLDIEEMEKKREFLRIWHEGKAKREKEKENGKTS
jgi:hypothetical protein